MTECMYEACDKDAAEVVQITDYLGADWNSALCKEHRDLVIAANKKG